MYCMSNNTSPSIGTYYDKRTYTYSNVKEYTYMKVKETVINMLERDEACVINVSHEFSYNGMGQTTITIIVPTHTFETAEKAIDLSDITI